MNENKTNINWAVEIYGQPLSILDEIRVSSKQIFTNLYKMGYEL